MANIVARHFLNDRGFKQLESSEGAVNVVHKKKKIGELEEIISRLSGYIGRNDKKIAKKETKIAELDSTSFVKKLFSFGKIKKERDAISEEIAVIKEQNAGYDAGIKNAEYEIVFLQNEIKRFAKKLEAVGLTVEDIIAEYNAIVAELKQRENEKKPVVVNAPESKPAESVGAEKPTKPASKTPLQRFQARQAKHEAIVKQRGE